MRLPIGALKHFLLLSINIFSCTGSMGAMFRVKRKQENHLKDSMNHLLNDLI